MQPDIQAAVCGGVWRSYYMGEPPNDIDIFCMSEDARRVCHQCLVQSRHVAHVSDRATMYTAGDAVPIHLVKKIHGQTLKEILSGFDFDICMFGTDFSHDCCPSGAATDLNIAETNAKWSMKPRSTRKSAFKVLFQTYRINRRTCALTSVPHAMRLYTKGFRLQPADLVDLIERAGLEISLLRASGSDPVKIMGVHY